MTGQGLIWSEISFLFCQVSGSPFHGAKHPWHKLINYIDNKAKRRHLKTLTSKGTLRQVFTRVYRLEITDTASCVDASLPFSLVQLTPPPPTPGE
jgi:hypothetical protein